MSDLPVKKIPSIAELYSGDVDIKSKQNELNILLNQEPHPSWLRMHPMASNVKYIPIERVEWLLTKIFIDWWIEVRQVQTIANSVVVTIRLYYKDVLSNEVKWQDGIGAAPIQTDRGAGAMDWNATKNDAVMKAAPAAESYAVKDAAEKIGKLFGKDMNRADKIVYDDLSKIVNYASPSQIALIESLLSTANISIKESTELNDRLNSITASEVSVIVDYLKANQIDRIAAGDGYSQGDIQAKLDQVMNDERK